MYTIEIICNDAVLKLITYSDGMALTAYLKDEYSFLQYYQYVDMLVSWLDNSSSTYVHYVPPKEEVKLRLL